VLQAPHLLRRQATRASRWPGNERLRRPPVSPQCGLAARPGIGDENRRHWPDCRPRNVRRPSCFSSSGGRVAVGYRSCITHCHEEHDAVDRGVDWAPGDSQHGQDRLCARGCHQCSSCARRSGTCLWQGEGLRFDSVTGLQVIDSFSNGPDERRGPSPGDALQLSLHRKIAPKALHRKLPLRSESPDGIC